jgi:hypothetical protein
VSAGCSPTLNVKYVRSWTNCKSSGHNHKDKNGATATTQVDWLGATLSSIAKSKQKRFLVIATHHPPHSQSGHSGSTEMLQSIDDICSKARVFPDVFLSAHAHNYHR